MRHDGTRQSRKTSGKWARHIIRYDDGFRTLKPLLSKLSMPFLFESVRITTNIYFAQTHLMHEIIKLERKVVSVAQIKLYTTFLKLISYENKRLQTVDVA